MPGWCTVQRGRPSSRRKPAELRARVLARYGQRYPDFGPTLAAEYLAREDGLKIDHKTLRRWLLAEGLRGVRRRRRPPARSAMSWNDSPRVTS